MESMGDFLCLEGKCDGVKHGGACEEKSVNADLL